MCVYAAMAIHPFGSVRMGGRSQAVHVWYMYLRLYGFAVRNVVRSCCRDRYAVLVLFFRSAVWRMWS